ncbi:MAG: class I SAM-dependent methyltransferase [Thermodesulfobacteriota bacterium]|nr:class I SAM-dependent methyltransferase [Thermodesulfobacteriota bacterium]
MAVHQDEHSHKHHHKGKSSEKIVDQNAVLTALKITPGEIVLDAGCGNGYMAKRFAELASPGGVVYAMDPDVDAIEKLKAETGNTIIQPFMGDMTKHTRLPDNAFDLIYVGMVTHGFSATEMDGFAKEVTRLLKPGGRLAIVEIKKEETPFGPPMDIRLSPEDLQGHIPLQPVALTDAGQYLYLQLFSRE